VIVGRKIRDAGLEGIGNRVKLERGEYHWRAVSQGRHIGYRRPEKEGGAGIWFARVIWKDEKGKNLIRKERLGVADDHLAADGEDILSFSQAQQKAEPVFEKVLRILKGECDVPRRKGVYTIGMACDDYLADYVRRGKKCLKHCSAMISNRIRPTFEAVDLARLRPMMIEDWKHAITTTGRMYHPPRHGQAKQAPPPRAPDEIRARMNTANRCLTVLLAILNFAHRQGKISTKDGWIQIKHYRNVSGVRNRFLKPEEQVRLVNSSEPGFRELLAGGMHTGCRLGELHALRVKHVNLEDQVIYIADSKSGKPRYVPLTKQGGAFFGSLIAGREGEDHVFLKSNGKPWTPSVHHRMMVRACKEAKIEHLSYYEASRHTYAANLVRLGVPLHVVAKALGHADLQMIIKHYGHLSPDYIGREIREKTDGVDLGLAGNVSLLALKGA
jgi:integrase